MIDPHAAMQHQMRMKILIQESISPDIQRKMKNKKDYTEEIATTSKNEVSQWRFCVPSPLMGEGENEGENQDLDPRFGVLKLS